MKTFAEVMWETCQRLGLDADCTKWEMDINAIFDAMKADLAAVEVAMTPGLFSFDKELDKTVGYDFGFQHYMDRTDVNGVAHKGDVLWLRRSKVETVIRAKQN